MLANFSRELLVDTSEADQNCVTAIQTVISFLDQHRFFIKLHRVDGTRQPHEDRELLRKFRSRSKNLRAEAVLDFLYSVRINLFHGHKTFEQVQLEVMRPANVLLLQIVEMLFAQLDR